MAEQSNQQERTQEPTQKRLQDAREKGQIPRSRELNTMLVTFTGACGLIFMSNPISNTLQEIFLQNYQLTLPVVLDKNYILKYFSLSSSSALLTLAPFFTLMFIIALFGPMSIGGMSISMNAMSFKFSRLSPIAGLKRMFGLRGLVELVKSLAKVALIGSIVLILLKLFMFDILGTGLEPVNNSVEHAYRLILLIFTISSAGLIAIAVIDVPYQIWQHHRQLRMTLQEVKDEMKQTEGNPENKGRLRNLQRELAQKRMMEAIPDADVIVTNPTHFAVALKYDVEKSNAPIVIAKGVDYLAEKIKEIAAYHKVNIFCAPALARAIYFSTELDKEIPSGLYIAVAKVLAYVHQLKKAVPGQYPNPPTEFEIPSEYQTS